MATLMTDWLWELMGEEREALQQRTATAYFGYGDPFWLIPLRTRTFATQCVHGQTVGVQPQAGTRMVLTSASESTSSNQNPQPYEERDALKRGVSQSLGGDLTAY